jgi:hypothetical protein
MEEPVLIDCRNIYSPQELVGLGFQYCGVGRVAGDGAETAEATHEERAGLSRAE